jgi:hypothetical protein
VPVITVAALKLSFEGGAANARADPASEASAQRTAVTAKSVSRAFILCPPSCVLVQSTVQLEKTSVKQPAFP